jgi:uncharacterized protein YcbK (DUF882 family)
MKITEHFTLEEFACHDGTPYPREWLAARLAPLCYVLESLRTALGDQAMTITSGYRTPAYNRQIGGARASQHVEGRAADIRVAGVGVARLHSTALALHEAGTIQLGGLGLYPRWVHVDVRPGARLARWGGNRTGEG